MKNPHEPPAPGQGATNAAPETPEPGDASEAPQEAPAAAPAWLNMGDGRPATLLPPWPDELVTAKAKNAALAWADRLSIPTRYKRSLLFKFARYTGVRFAAEDLAALEHFRPPPPRGT